MSYGAFLTVGSIQAARLYVVLSPHFVKDDILHLIGLVGISLTLCLPPILLTIGLAEGKPLSQVFRDSADLLGAAERDVELQP